MASSVMYYGSQGQNEMTYTSPQTMQPHVNSSYQPSTPLSLYGTSAATYSTGYHSTVPQFQPEQIALPLHNGPGNASPYRSNDHLGADDRNVSSTATFDPTYPMPTQQASPDARTHQNQTFGYGINSQLMPDAPVSDQYVERWNDGNNHQNSQH
ncbi:uncharacterized protein LY89DRAFT_320947 [Mollisia scopiformis]|uniref:Uncharacterized protein n=1 Tax=Mollisia scopiformis TaxID=149040 RepID=A0A132BBY7_MOLSC|nr:uncharacterized protein LY89DRAFT_320947 [Mollisia scopiformis]KUJ09167.1 hypothetical protein LY89DRAFT_320947 [Mollisia scopiformis]